MSKVSLFFLLTNNGRLSSFLSLYGRYFARHDKKGFFFPQPPLLCPLQEASYILSFEDEEGEEWPRAPVEIDDSGGAVEVILDTDIEPLLKRERNYTLRVTVVTQYANISSTTHFSKSNITVQSLSLSFMLPLGTESLQISPGYYIMVVCLEFSPKSL